MTQKDRSVGPYCPPDEWWRGYLTSWNKENIGDISLDAVEIEDVPELVKEAQRKVWEKADQIIRETMDSMELNTNEEFIACDDLAIKIIKAINAKLDALGK